MMMILIAAGVGALVMCSAERTVGHDDARPQGGPAKRPAPEAEKAEEEARQEGRRVRTPRTRKIPDHRWAGRWSSFTPWPTSGRRTFRPPTGVRPSSKLKLAFERRTGTTADAHYPQRAAPERHVPDLPARTSPRGPVKAARAPISCGWSLSAAGEPGDRPGKDQQRPDRGNADSIAICCGRRPRFSHSDTVARPTSLSDPTIKTDDPDRSGRRRGRWVDRARTMTGPWASGERILNQDEIDSLLGFDISDDDDSERKFRRARHHQLGAGLLRTPPDAGDRVRPPGAVDDHEPCATSPPTTWKCLSTTSPRSALATTSTPSRCRPSWRCSGLAGAGQLSVC